MIFSPAAAFLALCALGDVGLSNPIPERRAGNPEPTVNLPGPANVSFRGISNNSVESFLNIHFGQDTSGNNRFASPKPYTYPPGSVVDSSLPGAACPQQTIPLGPSFSVFDNVTNISEDCLTLRVDRPVGTSSSSKLPVMVYIYGGGDTIGQIYDSAYDPTMLVSSAAEKGVPIIFAAMNYRLGFFGFAVSPALNATDSLNAGLLDQRLALDWIQEHISAFGGDPDNVTVFGESDGATGVGLQITAYGGERGRVPFQKAIMQSGGATADTGTGTKVSAIRTAELTALLNCTSSNSTEELACLRKLPLQTILSSAIQYEFNINPFGGFDVFIPVSPSTFIPDRPSNLLTSGKFARNLDIITGWNEDDGSLFVPTTLASESDVVEWLRSSIPAISNETIKEALGLYPTSTFPSDPTENVTSQYFRASQMSRDFVFTCASMLMVETNVKYSGRNSSNYLFAINQTIFAPLYASQNVSYYGISHFSDIPYVFDQATTRYADVSSPLDIKLSDNVSGSWVSFANFGDPSKGNGTISGWADVVSGSNTSGNDYNIQILGGPNPVLRSIGSSGTYNESVSAKCAFWNSERVLAELGV